MVGVERPVEPRSATARDGCSVGVGGVSGSTGGSRSICRRSRRNAPWPITDRVRAVGRTDAGRRSNCCKACPDRRLTRPSTERSPQNGDADSTAWNVSSKTLWAFRLGAGRDSAASGAANTHRCCPVSARSEPQGP